MEGEPNQPPTPVLKRPGINRVNVNTVLWIKSNNVPLSISFVSCCVIYILDFIVISTIG